MMLDVDEFDSWLRYHDSLFSGVHAWLMDPVRDEACNRWYEVLAVHSVEVLKAASVSLWKRPSSRKPNGYTNHVGDLLEIIQEGRRYGGETYTSDKAKYAFRCGLCSGGGQVEVELIDGTEGVISHEGRELARTKNVVAACGCPAGSRYVREGSPFPRYDGSRMRPLRPQQANPERIRELIAQAQSRGHHRWARVMERMLSGEKFDMCKFADSLFGAA